MPDLFDYLVWRGDIPVSQVPIGPVDGLILSTLVYVHFDDVLSPDLSHPVTVGEAARVYLSLPEQRRGPVRCKTDLELLAAIQSAPRFAQLELAFYEDRFVPEEEMQFAAMAVLPGDGSAFLAFRGTDTTLVGWKEDFNMSFMDTVPAQRAALDYLKRFAAAFPGPLTLGGHSKGGNLAVFAASLAPLRVRDRIQAIYNNDAPGFTATVLDSPGYTELLTRIHSFVPQSSVVGMLLEHEEPYTVVKSRHIGPFQHDPYTWEILGGDFIRLEEVNEGSRIFDRTVKTWVANLSMADRNRFVDAVFDLLEAGDPESVKDLLHPRSLFAAVRALKDTDDRTRRLLAETLVHLIRAAAGTLKESSGTDRP